MARAPAIVTARSASISCVAPDDRLGADFRRTRHQKLEFRLESKFGSYQLLERVGSGAMGHVYRATRDGGRSSVALKVMRGDLMNDETLVNRLLQERALLTSMSHECLLKVFDLILESGYVAIAMEFAPGGDLRRLQAESQVLAADQALRIMLDVLWGVAYVHDNGIIHRDIKPANILLTAEGRPKLGDFGIAKMLTGSALTRATGIIGTPDYLAPEIVDSDQVGPEVDVYSAGVVLYELLAGRLPFVGSHPLAVLRMHVECPPTPIPGLSASHWRLLDRMLAKNPSSRPTAVEAAQEMELLLSSAPADDASARSTKRQLIEQRTFGSGASTELSGRLRRNESPLIHGESPPTAPPQSTLVTSRRRAPMGPTSTEDPPVLVSARGSSRRRRVGRQRKAMVGGLLACMMTAIVVPLLLASPYHAKTTPHVADRGARVVAVLQDFALINRARISAYRWTLVRDNSRSFVIDGTFVERGERQAAWVQVIPQSVLGPEVRVTASASQGSHLTELPDPGLRWTFGAGLHRESFQILGGSRLPLGRAAFDALCTRAERLGWQLARRSPLLSPFAGDLGSSTGRKPPPGRTMPTTTPGTTAGTTPVTTPATTPATTPGTTPGTTKTTTTQAPTPPSVLTREVSESASPAPGSIQLEVIASASEGTLLASASCSGGGLSQSFDVAGQRSLQQEWTWTYTYGMAFAWSCTVTNNMGQSGVGSGYAPASANGTSDGWDPLVKRGIRLPVNNVLNATAPIFGAESVGPAQDVLYVPEGSLPFSRSLEAALSKSAILLGCASQAAGQRILRSKCVALSSHRKGSICRTYDE